MKINFKKNPQCCGFKQISFNYLINDFGHSSSSIINIKVNGVAAIAAPNFASNDNILHLPPFYLCLNKFISFNLNLTFCPIIM